MSQKQVIQINPKCSSCYNYFVPTFKTSRLPYKSCVKCVTRKNQKCIHDKLKTRCIECGGRSLCIHDKRKTMCRECGGGEYCIHDKEKRKCRRCNDPIKLTIARFIQKSKSKDKEKNIFDIVNFIDSDFCKLLIGESDNKCCYCKIELEFIEYGPSLISIERKNNSIGHIKSNVKIACLGCNCRRVGTVIK